MKMWLILALLLVGGFLLTRPEYSDKVFDLIGAARDKWMQ